MRGAKLGFFLLGLALAFSADSRAQQEGAGTKPTVVLDSSLTSDGKEAADTAAWLLFAMDKVAQYAARAPRNGPLEDYGIELHARTQLADYWRKEARGKAKRKDAYLDKLVEINDAGFMPEYVLSAFPRPGWTLTAEELRALRLEPFNDWASKHLRGFVSVTLAGVQPDESRDAGPPGRGLPDPRMYAPGRVPCASSLPPLRAALEQWESEAAGLRAPPLAAGSAQEFVETVVAVRTEEPYRSRGLTWVLPQPGLLSYYAGYCAIETGDLVSARRWLEQATVMSPRSAPVLQEFIHVLVFEGRLDDADAQVERILVRAQDRCDLARAWRRRGYIRYEQQRWPEARTAYQRSLDFDPDSALARSELSLIEQNIKAGGGEPSPYTPSQQFTTHCTE